MKSTLLILSIVLVVLPLISAQEKVILDTDPGYDPDDVGCMAMLHSMASLGECEILAIINSTVYKESAPSISAINTFYNRQAIPVGDYQGYSEKIDVPKEKYTFLLTEAYPRALDNWREAVDGVDLYREILATATDKSITIVIIGTMHNFYALLQSGPDQFSSDIGVELVKKKVKLVGTMGGNFIEGRGYDRTNWGGAEALCSYTSWSCLNEERNRMCRYVIDHCPAPFIASGWEVGCGDYNNANYGNVMTGQGLKSLDENHIVRKSYEYHFKHVGSEEEISRHSNDQCALHFAIRGEQNNYKAYTNGNITLSNKGVCSWNPNVNNKQGYIQKNRDKDSIAIEIERLMMGEIPGKDLTPPTAPDHLEFSRSDQKTILTWESAQDTTLGSWVVGYHIYRDGELVRMAYGTQYFDDHDAPVSFEVRAVNVHGIESKSSVLSIDK